MSKAELLKFSNMDFGEIRGVNISGEPWLVGKDVATVLGYSDTNQAIRKHVDTEDKLTRRFDGSGQNRQMSIINESGFYSLAFGSKLPEAKKFKRWVTHDVLPQIRKTGGYIPVKPDDTKDDIIKRDNEILRKTIAAQSSIIDMTKDGFVKYTQWINVDGLLSLNQAAKILGVGRNTMDKHLVQKKVLFHSGNFVLPYSTYEKRKYFVVKVHTTYGGRGISQTFVTPKGLDFVHDKLFD